MNNAAIVSIGNELLSGLVDTNAAYLCEELLSLGIPVVSCYTAGDEIKSIVRVIKLAKNDAELVITTGGLGPTDDDITRTALANLLDVELVPDAGVLRKIEDFFAARHAPMPQRNRVQALIPAGARPIANEFGTAPGIEARIGKKLLFALPGVPVEMKMMFEKLIAPQLRQLHPQRVLVVKKIKCFGAGESEVAELLGELMQRGRNPLVNCTVDCGLITLSIAAAAERMTAEKMAEETEHLIRKKLGRLVFGSEEETLAEVVGGQLLRRKKTLAVAESCTGGLLSKLITDAPGASKYFTHGWVTYSNGAKRGELQVASETIENYGAVSAEVAAEMAENARTKAKTDFAVAITGIAGPGGATEQKDVGLVYISICSDDEVRTKRFVFSHDRQSIRLRSALTALNLVRLELGD